MTTTSKRSTTDISQLRERAAAIKKQVIANLDHYLVETEKQVNAHGGHVVFAQTIDDAVDYILLLAKERGVEHLVGARATELANEKQALRNEIEAVGSDLGSYLAGRARHPDASASFQLERLLAAGIGITGANFVVADAGAICIVQDDDSGRLASAAPKIHVAVAGIEKIIPRTRDLAIFLRLLSARFPAQTSLLSGPRRADELDGPEEFFLILLDGGRSTILADPAKRELLQCIRCGACLAHCPVTPVGQKGALTQLLTPPHSASPLVHASTLCGACGEACPVRIDLPRVLVALRQDDRRTLGGWRAWLLNGWVFVMQRPRLYEFVGLIARAFWPASWKGAQPTAKSFRQLWRGRGR